MLELVAQGIDNGEFHAMLGSKQMGERICEGQLCLRDQLRNQRLIELGWEVRRFWVYEIRDRLPQCTKQVQNWVAVAEATMK